MKGKGNSDETVRQILNNYLEQNNCRKTPERFAILDAVYDFDSFFSMQELGDKLAGNNFPVSRATLYNTIKLLLRLNLVVSLRMQDGVRYKASLTDNGCVSVCTVCGKVTDVRMPGLMEVFDNTHIRRFRNENFTMHIYGVCSTCQAMLTRMKKKEKTNKNNKQFKENGTRQS